MMLSKWIVFLIVFTLLGGILMLFIGLMAMDSHLSSRPLLAVVGAILFASGLIALSIHANRSK